ncbi:MAG: hypothetical protein OCU12_00445 [Methanophagales archaeon]|nr:hypothetical protein [Methanophagales archaeon]
MSSSTLVSATFFTVTLAFSSELHLVLPKTEEFKSKDLTRSRKEELEEEGR